MRMTFDTTPLTAASNHMIHTMSVKKQDISN